MCVVLKPDVIVASVVKRLYNFYSILDKHFTKDKTISKAEHLQKYHISIQDCIKRQQDAHFSSLGVVVADSDHSDFENFLESKNDTFVRCGYDCYTLTEKAKNYCLSNNSDDINKLMDDIIDNAYSMSTLRALDII